MIDYKKLLKSKKYNIAVWGTGYIGLSTLVYFAKQNVRCIGYDLDSSKVEKINNGDLPIKDLKNWFGFNIKKLVKEKKLKATNNFNELIDQKNLAHFVAIPTEKDGKPYFKILFDVLNKILKVKQIKKKYTPIIIIESTLTPGFSEKHLMPFFKKKKIKIGRDLLYSVAPRRDWFVEGTKSLRELDRVFGSTDKKSSRITKSILSIVCKKLHEASSHKVSEMVKSIENAYRHMEITLANQLSLAYPKENMREVLKLVGTKWNIGTFYPGFGTGGYCIPLSSQYVLREVSNKKKLTLLRETIKTDTEINKRIANSLAKRKFKSIGVLGLSYKGNLKVDILSPVKSFINCLLKKRINVRLYDPYYNSDEIKEKLKIKSFKFPNDLIKFDAVVISVDHDKFKKKFRTTKKYLSNCKFILDNMGIWSKFKKPKNIDYKISGQKNWI